MQHWHMAVCHECILGFLAPVSWVISSAWLMRVTLACLTCEQWIRLKELEVLGLWFSFRQVILTRLAETLLRDAFV